MKPAMARIPALLVVASGFACSLGSAAERDGIRPSVQAMAVQAHWLRQVDSLAASLKQLEQAAMKLEATAASMHRAREAFRTSRLWYKSIEFAATYYEPSTGKLLNGPALPRAEPDEGPEVVFPPEGFQVIEELLFADEPFAGRAKAIEEIRNAIELVARLKNAMSSQVVTDERVWDAAKVGIARVATLGIAGFDSPIASHGLVESAASLAGIRATLAAYDSELQKVDSGASMALDSAFARGIHSLRVGGTPDDFDRLAFIAMNVTHITSSIARARAVLNVAFPDERRGFRVRAASVFDTGAFDPQAFGAPGTQAQSARVTELGRALLSDRRLSGDGTRSCATCHDPGKAFVDRLARSPSLQRGTRLRNSPTLINAGLQAGAFYDLRTAYLEDQVTEVVRSASEMHSTVGAAASRLASDSATAIAFAAAFGESSPESSSVTPDRIRRAIAAYVRSLTRLDSRVDRAMRGDLNALDSEERTGFNLFMGKARCGTCHFAPLFNGTVPPMYDDAEVEVIGVPTRAVVRRARVDPDSGRFTITKSVPHLHAFKTPTVRNAGVTAPYMHNGVFRTLEEVVDFYDLGGGAGIGISLPNQTLPPDALKLTPPEKRALVRFMQALTDTTR